MTFGEKLTKLRKEHNYTQEQLAEILGVSRQSISKWESDLAYPETEKLIRIGELFDCSMDYLLKDGQETTTVEKTIRWIPRTFYYEKKSTRAICGVPLWHINIGLGRTAKGIFAVGLSAIGVVSVGVFSLGLIALGVLAIGLLALGSIAMGVIAAGAIAAGIIAVGAIAVGVLSLGAMAIGNFSFGALAIGKYLAVGDHARAMIAIGKSEAVGVLYQGSHEMVEENRASIVSLLDQHVPGVWKWLVGIAKFLV